MIARARLCLVSTLFLVWCGCAHHVGSQTTSGALSELEQQIAAEPGQRPAEAIARRATKGVIAELNEPEEKERLDAVMSDAADDVRGAFTQGLTDDLGADGNGPLAQSIVALAERSAARAAHGAVATLLAPCDPESPTCIDHRLADLSTRAAVAFVDGVKRSLGLAALAIAFLAGAATVLVIGVFWRLARRTSDPGGSRSDKRGRSPAAPAALDARAPASTSA